MRNKNIAVVGMACTFPRAEDLTRFWYNLVNGIDAFALPSLQEADAQMPGPLHASAPEVDRAAHGWLGHIIRQALQDAGLSLHAALQCPMQLVVDQQTSDTGIAPAVRIAQELGPKVTAYAVNSAEMRTLRALTRGVHALREGHCDILVLATGYRLDNDDRQVAAAVVLQRQADVEQAGDRAYALLKGIVTTTDGELQQAYIEADITPEHIGLLETQGCSFAPRELDAISAVFGPPHTHRALRPLGTLSVQTEQPPAALGLASFIKAVLCLNHKLIPPTLYREVLPGALEQLPFYLNSEPRPWIHDASLPPRRVAVHVQDTAGEATHIVLEEITADGTIRPRPIKTELAWDSEVVVLGADTPAALAGRAEQLRAFLHGAGAEVSLADVAYTQCLQFAPQARCRLAIVCSSLQELLQHLELCYSRLQTSAPHFDDLQTIYFTANGTRLPGKIAWLFPGLGFPGLPGLYADHLLELVTRFPEVRGVFDLVDGRDRHPEDPTPTHQICFPSAALPEAERHRLRQRLASPQIGHAALMEIPSERNLAPFGVAVANWASRSLLHALQVPVDMIFGQSYGEMIALCAAGALRFPEVVRLHCRVEISAQYVAGRGRLALVSASVERLATWLARFQDVSIAIHVAPHFQILGGEVHQLEQLLIELRQAGIWIQLLPYPAVHTPHYTLLRPAVQPYLEELSVHACQVLVYSGMTGDVYSAEPDAVRQTILANLDSPVLLWQTTQKMYQDGARLFIQVGGGANMDSHAKTNIGAADVVAVSLDVDHRSAITQLNHLCATLITNGVCFDLAHLFAYRSLKLLHLEAAVSVQDFPAVTMSDTPRQEPVTGLTERRMPFIDRVLHYVENQEIAVERVLDLQEDLFLAHHLFIVAEGLKPTSACLPVLPMTVSMEVMAEVAAYLVPGCGLLGFENVKATRWIALEDSDTLRLYVSARLHHYDHTTGLYRIAVSVYVADQDRPVVHATVLLGQQYLMSVDLRFAAPHNPHPHPLSPQQIYAEKRLFHGPVFQCLGGNTVLAERAVSGTLAVLPKDSMFRSTRQPELLTDPILLDGVGQLVGLWAMEQGVYVFPITIRKLEFYRSTPAVGTQVPVYLDITQYNSRFLHANAEIQDGAGNVWMRIQEWGDWVFHWPKKVYDFRRQPMQYCPSHPLTLPGVAEGAVARRITKSDLRDMEPHAMARFYLHMDEMPQFHQLAAVPARQQQWLLGRIAAKDAVRRWLAHTHGIEMPHPAAFMMANDAKGQPMVQYVAGPDRLPQLSIAHSDDRAVAIAHAEPTGIDIERLAERQARWLETITTAGERDLLARLPSDELQAWSTRLWCAKEAAGKLLGTGIDGAPQRFEALDLRPDGTITILHHASGRSMVVHTLREDDFIIAYTVSLAQHTESYYVAH
jgi:phosphopantetheinyl transferase/malonyl CoA-acyl carrier protein transacylase